ncbi:DUF2066 domain-containing protein [Alteromonas sp. C1M14]|uniref:DUF2066 domain-containing protein n=1 Tax=Alteromonas sp. C1M14 TaxID=2841567 RepID=UPI001C096D7A|nr:DUF2066 domain-containing protein [Alteromonas sp. C1M14]
MGFSNLFGISRVLVLGLLLMGSVSISQAGTVVSVSQGRVEVQDQSQKTQRSAAQQALKQVMIKLSGQREIVTNAVVKSAIRNPQQYMRSYRFEYDNSTLYYIAEFDFQALSAMIQQEALPLWGQRRPDTVMWLAIEDENGDKAILDDGSSSEIAAQLRALSQERAVPLVFPLMDFTDSTSISIYDVWGRFAQNLSAASQRYTPDYIVGARLFAVKDSAVPELNNEQQTQQQAANMRFEKHRPALANQGVEGLSEFLVDDLVEETHSPAFSEDEFEQMSNQKRGAYELDWVVISQGNIEFGTLYGDDQLSLASLFFEEYADFLGQHFAIVPSDKDQATTDIVISVANLDSLKKYVHVEKYLADMSMVRAVTLVKQEGSVASFSLALLADTQDFYNLVALDARLKPVVDRTGQPVEGFNFYWNE